MEQLHAKLLLLLDHYLRPLDADRALLKLRIAQAPRLYRDSPFQSVPDPRPLPEILADEVAALVATGEGGGPTLADRVAELSDDYRRPIVVRGLMDRSVAVRTWSLARFAELTGPARYPVMADAVEQDPLTKQQDMVMMSLPEMIAAMDRGGRPYVNNLTRIFGDHPELVDELELHRLYPLLGDVGDEAFSLVNLFLGGPGTGTAMHAAFAGNFFCEIVGRKRWRFIAPEHTDFLVPMPARPFIFSNVHFDPGEDADGRNASRLPSFETVLEPGDVLYNAPWWWHRVDNVDDITVGCAVRNLRFFTDLRNHAMFTLMSQSGALSAMATLHAAKNRLLGRSDSFRDLLQRELDGAIFDGIAEAEVGADAGSEGSRGASGAMRAGL